MSDNSEPEARPLFRVDFGGERFVDLAEQEDYEFPHPLQRSVMPVLILDVEDAAVTDARVVGTCFAIGSNLAVTASHVLTGDLPVLVAGEMLVPPNVSPHVLFVTAQPVPNHEGPWGGLLPVDKIVMNPDHDLTLLRLRLPLLPDGSYPRFAGNILTVDPPPVGSPLVVLGYSDSSSSFTPPDKVHLDHKLRASAGVVQELHIPRRDSVLLNFPALSGDFPSPGGMSGSPVMNGDGKVCAMVSRSLAPSLDDDLWTSSASLLALLFSMEIELNLDGLVDVFSLYDLAERGVVPTDGSHRKLEFRNRDDGRIDIVWRR